MLVVQQGMDFLSLEMPLSLYFYATSYIICKLYATQSSLLYISFSYIEPTQYLQVWSHATAFLDHFLNATFIMQGHCL